jgi:hypothetical protein
MILDYVGVNFGEGSHQPSVFVYMFQAPDSLSFDGEVGFEDLQEKGQLEGWVVSIP